MEREESILVLGANGMLGSAVKKYFMKKYYTASLTREYFDASREDVSKLESIIKEHTVVINCIGVIKSVIKDHSELDVLYSNSMFPNNLAKLCKKHNVKLFHITTDCVYSGKKGKYTEDDFMDAEDLYGISKALGEPANAMVLRTSIIGEEHNTDRSLMAWVKSKSNQMVSGYINHLWNGVTTYTLADIINQILKRELYTEGTFHVHSHEDVTKAQLVLMISDVYNYNVAVHLVEASISCDRTLHNKTRLNDMLEIPNLHTQLEQMRVFFKNE